MIEQKITYLEKKLTDLINFSNSLNSLPESSLRTIFNQDSQVKLQKLLKLGATADDQIISQYISLDDLTKTKLQFLVNQTQQLTNTFPLSTSDLYNVRKVKLAYYFYNALSPYRQKRRFTISPINSGDFEDVKMYINPNRVEVSREKRYAEHDVINGVIFQDFGYKPRVITIHSTTGSEFYEGIEKLNKAYLNKKSRIVKVTFGGLETDILNNKGNFEFKAAWKNFNFDIDTETFLIKYTMTFSELKDSESSTTTSITSAIESVITSFNLAKAIDKSTTIEANQLVATSNYVPKLQEDMYMYNIYNAGTISLKNLSINIGTFDELTGVVSRTVDVESDITTEAQRIRDAYALSYTDEQLDESIAYTTEKLELLLKNLSPIEFNALDLSTYYNDIYSEHMTRINTYSNYYKYIPINMLNSLTSLVYSNLNTIINRVSYGIVINENFQYYLDIVDRFFKIYYSIILPKKTLDDVVLEDIESAYEKLIEQTEYSGTETGAYHANESVILTARASYVKKVIVNLLDELDTTVRYENDDLDDYVARNFSKTMEMLKDGTIINGINGSEQANFRLCLRRDNILRNNIDEFVFIIVWYYAVDVYNNNSTVNGSYKY